MSTPAAHGSGKKARILIVDDHAIVRRGLAALLAEEPDLEICGEAADTAEALRQLALHGPDLVLVDITLKDGNGIDLIRQMRARDECTRMVVLSMHDESLFAERALRAGALGYVHKQEPAEKILDAIREVLGGGIYLSTSMTERVLRRTLTTGGRPVALPAEALSDRELQVFELIGQGLTTRDIAGKLHLSIKTVETYREHIKAKLHLKNGAELGRHAAQWVVENGFAGTADGRPPPQL
jgi:DNA-binding NarL/FixJ family response regulator